MTGGLRGQSESVLSWGGERLQLPWLPHAIEGGVEEEDVGEAASSHSSTCESSISSCRAFQWHMPTQTGTGVKGLISYRRDLSATLCSCLLAED